LEVGILTEAPRDYEESFAGLQTGKWRKSFEKIER
jgi:hypothetical protein